MRIYIAGPMSGRPEFNYPAFFKAAEALAYHGHEPINPARQQGREDCREWLDFMRAALRDIAGADGIAFLPGWEDSRGASIEVALGDYLGLDVRPLEAWLGAAA